jgi:hypothetical protein
MSCCVPWKRYNVESKSRRTKLNGVQRKTLVLPSMEHTLPDVLLCSGIGPTQEFVDARER